MSQHIEHSFAQSCNQTAQGFSRAATSALRLPFDMAREQYANAVQAGFIQSSMLASRDLGLALDAFEKVTLGPWARRV